MAVFSPSDADELARVIAWAAAETETLELVGTGSKRALGRPVQAAHTLDLSRLAGVIAYEPEELVLTVRPATAMAELEALLAQRGQHFAFEPPDLGPLLGLAPGGGTLGGVLAAALSGPRRLSAGAARDHLLGFQAVTGRGDIFKAGGRVVKNVTGYDLMKPLCGSWGTLAAMTEVTVKVMPAPAMVTTVVVHGLTDGQAVRAMTSAMRSPHEVAAAAHVPADLAPDMAGLDGASTLIRVEGVPPSVGPRTDQLVARLREFGPVSVLDDASSRPLWTAVRDVAPFAARPEALVWRLSVAPTAGAVIVARVQDAAPGARALYDWSGGLIWLGLPPVTADGSTADDAWAGLVRQTLAAAGPLGDQGHATLIRAPATIRAAVPVFQPLDPAVAALSARVKTSFDPGGILNPGRMG